MFTKVTTESKQSVRQLRSPLQVYEVVDQPGRAPLALESKGVRVEKESLMPRSNSKGKGDTSMSLPPRITYAPTIKHKWRFTPSSSNASVCNANNLLAVAGGIASSATNLYTLASTCRVISIDIWPSASTSTSEDCNVQWQGPIVAVERDSRSGRDLPEGLSVTGRFHATPPKWSFAGAWISAGTLGIFTIASPPGSIVDITMEHTLSNALSNQALTGSGMTTGDLYYGGLDSVGSPNYVPIGRPVS